MGAGAIQDSAGVDRESLVDREPHGLVFAEHEYDPVVLSEDRLAPRPHGPRHAPAVAQDLVALRAHRRTPLGAKLIGPRGPPARTCRPIPLRRRQSASAPTARQPPASPPSAAA